jgi:ParB-like chromosome segregation protein Spo0J
MELNQHPLSAAFPAMQDEEYNSLVESITAIGLQNPIVLYQGMVIDGWHRYCACLDSGTAIKTIQLSDDVDPQTFVIAQNKERRHLTKSQVALAAVKVYEWLKDGVKQGFQASSAPSAEVKSAKEIANIAGVSTRSVEQAKAVETKATDEVKAKVATGEMSLKKAEETLKTKIETPSHDDYAPSQNEIDEAEAFRLAREVLLDTLTDADTAFADVSAKLLQSEAMNAILVSRNNGLMNENAALSKLLKKANDKLARLAKA